MYDNPANFFIYFSLPIVNSTKYTSVEQLISLHTSLGSVAKIYSNPATERASLKSDLSGKAALNRSKPSVPGMEVHITDLETNKTTEFFLYVMLQNSLVQILRPFYAVRNHNWLKVLIHLIEEDT